MSRDTGVVKEANDAITRYVATGAPESGIERVKSKTWLEVETFLYTEYRCVPLTIIKVLNYCLSHPQGFVLLHCKPDGRNRIPAGGGPPPTVRWSPPGGRNEAQQLLQ